MKNKSWIKIVSTILTALIMIAVGAIILYFS